MREAVAALGGVKADVLDGVGETATPVARTESLLQPPPPPEQPLSTPSASGAGNRKGTAGDGSCDVDPSNSSQAAVSPECATGADTLIGNVKGVPAAAIADSREEEVKSSTVRWARGVVVKSGGDGGSAMLNKSDLLKRTIDRNTSEPWAECDRCGKWGHQARMSCLVPLLLGRNMWLHLKPEKNERKKKVSTKQSLSQLQPQPPFVVVLVAPPIIQ